MPVAQRNDHVRYIYPLEKRRQLFNMQEHLFVIMSPRYRALEHFLRFILIICKFLKKMLNLDKILYGNILFKEIDFVIFFY